MKPVSEIRRENLEALLKTNSQVAIASAAGGKTSPVYINQLRKQTPDKSTGRPRTMGSDLARRIERGMGLPDGWMDADHSAESGPISGDEAEVLRVYRAAREQGRGGEVLAYALGIASTVQFGTPTATQSPPVGKPKRAA